ncbi:uncharacterized protein LOC132640800 [Lycium barbarum]|uniref:uncharacterized protein LOC132067138 n=1 Tax=Lycium ferocissimum TaxID=112874 RepID=UPI00281520B9|nr:uncharacterized protein LOC132067138 [Lycium ferocissimum]XP_060213554.1 uncharacterized protein LOC132640800 [Lycium barbarum]
MAELQPPDASITAVALPSVATTTTTTTPTTSIAPPPPPPSDNNPPTNNNNLNNNNSNPSLAPKRQRRPSVRLGEIGDSPSETHFRRAPTKTWRYHKDPTLAAKTSKTRPLTNLVNGGATDNNYDEDNSNYNLDLGNRKSKSRKPTKRVRTNWHSSTSAKFETPNGGEDNFFDNNDNEEFREFEPEGSESPVKEHSPVNSMEHMGLQYWDRRGIRTRVSESRDDLNNGGVHNEMNSGDKSIGVRDWLIGLGLGRYAPVFEIHEVDDEVLPMLTLEDLKDMGINAVGSRRKMFSAILKLRKGFS